MSRARSPLLVLFLTVFIDMVGFGIVIPVLPLYAERFQASPMAIGWLTGIYSGMQIIFTPILGKLSDRFGRRPVLMLSLAGTAVGFALMGIAESLVLLFVARIISGITGGNIAIPQAYIADVTTPETRSKWMGMIGAAFGLGFTFGPMIGGIMSRISYSAPFYFAAALTVANVILLYFILPESLPKEHRAKPHADAPVVEVFRHGNGWLFGLVVATYFFLIVGFTIMTAFFALFTFRRFGYDAHANGYLFGFIGIVTVIVQGGLIGRLVAMFGETALARTGLVITAASLALLPFCHNLTWLLSRLRGPLVRQWFLESATERTRVTVGGPQLARSRSRRGAIRRQHRATDRPAPRRLAFDARSSQADDALRRNRVFRRGAPLPHRCGARLLHQETGRRSRADEHPTRFERIAGG
jgi:multidrug resistance protein